MSDTNSSITHQNQLVNSQEYDAQNDFNLLDVANFMRLNAKYLIFGMMLGVIVALIIAVLLPKQYEAKALIKIGQIGNIDTKVMPIEPVLQVVDRIKSQSFQDTVLEALGVSIENDDDVLVKQFRKNLKVKLEKSELISLSLKASSRAEAVVIMHEVVKQLNLTHNRMLHPTVSRLKLELESINNELELADNESKRLMKMLETQSDKITDTTFSQTVLLNSLRITKDQEFRSFKDTKRILEEKLSPDRTFATHVLGRVEVSKKPIFPKHTFFAVAGLFLGFMLSILVVAIKSLKPKTPINE